jgi:calreticulin
MFGPDVCGANRRVHLILNHGGQGRMIKKRIDFSNDELTHMYTLVLSQPAQTYRVLIDGEEVASGNIIDDIEGMSEEPRTIPDPTAVKPADWDDRAAIPDSEDSKPANWDAEHPRKVADPEAAQPADWNEATQGTWTAPEVDNPDFAEWAPRMIPNPAFQGAWAAPQIPNPNFKENPEAAVYRDLGHVAFDLWQVKAGTIFDNVLVTDDLAIAQQQLEELFDSLREAEKEAERAWFRSMHPEAAAQAEQAMKDSEEAGVEASNNEDQFGSETEQTEL